MGRLMSWRAINFDRWTAFAYAVVEADPGAGNDLMSAIPRLRLSWERLRDDLRDLFLPSGPVGTHAHEHYHPPFGPDEYQRVLTACVTDYESALLFLDVALEVTARGVGAASGLPIAKWMDLVKLAEQGDDRISESLIDHMLYLQRVLLYARNYAIAHPGGQLATVSHDNVGNIMYWRVPSEVDSSLLAEADELLHRVRPEIQDRFHVGSDISPYHALTWIGSRAAELGPGDRKLFEKLRAGLGYWLPGPHEIADNVNAALEELIDLLPGNGFGAIALHGRGPMTASADPSTDVEEVAAPTEDPNAGMADIEQAVSLGEAGKLAEAETALANVLLQHPESAVGHLAMAETLHRMQRYPAAIEHYRLAQAIGVPGVQIREGLADSHFNLAAAAYNEGDLTRAIEHYGAVVRLQPDAGNAHGHLAVALARDEQIDAALLNAELALVRHADQPEVRLDVGLALLACGNVSAALENFTAARDLRPGWADAEAYRGAALAELGHADAAKQALSAALAAEPEHLLARAALDELTRNGPPPS
jgi:tetratricopeptide (TPR) repeat protein